MVFEWGRLGKSRKWMAAEIGVTDQVMCDWRNRHPEFREATDLAKLYEQQWWEDAGQNGLTSNLFNAAVWRQSMAARFHDDYMVKTNVTLGGDQDNPLQVQHGVRWMTEAEAKARGWA